MPKLMLWLLQSKQARALFDRRDRIPEVPVERIPATNEKVNILECSMNVFIFLGGALVGAYYNTAVLTVASACAGACTKGAQIILQLVA